jgi:D-hexose-6-phosphate mutarotase
MNSEILNQEFGIEGHISFRDINEDTVVVDVSSQHSRASIVMQGAHLIHWQPVDCGNPVIWLSQDARFVRGKSIRGGIPVCWPWFGPHESEAHFPAHGYARTVDWELLSSKLADDERVELQFRLIDNDHSRSLWPYACECRLHFIIGKTLKVSLTTDNQDKQAFVLGEALHTYFAISDIEHVQLTGLGDCAYYDKVADNRGRQQGAIRFGGETDRVYMNTGASCVIEDADWQRNIIINKSASQSTVVWNPWQAKAEDMGDLGRDGWRRMLCVESANAMDNRLTLAPGESHTLLVEYVVENR